jgi:GntR family transcriptional regulator/MocR family aminotransferase
VSDQKQTESFAPRPRAKGAPVFRWLSEEIRAAILDGRFPPGSRLPSRVELARKYRLSIGTVVAAFELLLKAGYVDAVVGRGTYVSLAAPEAHGERDPARRRTQRRTLSVRGRLLAARSIPDFRPSRSAGAFPLACPVLDIFPVETWQRLAVRRMRAGMHELAAHGHPLGYPPLRAAIAKHVSDTRGVRCTPGQVIVTSGTQDSLDLVATLLLDPGDRVWMEDPGYAPATSLFRAHGLEVIGVPVDAGGIDCDSGQLTGAARLAYVTPACQFPLGMSMSVERRVKLLHWASETGAWIFEDDYDSQLQCDGRPPAPLYNLDRASSVIYSGSFNRMLFSSLRIGFLILPPPFIESAAAARSMTRRYHPTLDQAVLSDFIEEGHLEEHLRRAREVCAARRQALIGAARGELDGLLRFDGSQSGLQLVGWLAPGLSESEAGRRAAARGIDAVALSSLTIGRSMPAALVLGICGSEQRAIRTAVKRLGRVLRVLAWQEIGSIRPGEPGAGTSRAPVSPEEAGEPQCATMKPPVMRTP